MQHGAYETLTILKKNLKILINNLAGKWQFKY